MPFSDPQRHLHDILEAIDRIGEFVGGMDLAAYQADEKTKAAVERKLQILTEAIIRLEEESRMLTRRSIRKDIEAWGTCFGIPTIA